MLASQLPEFVTIDLSGLVKGQTLHASDLQLPEGIKAVRHGTLNPVIVSVTTPTLPTGMLVAGPVPKSPWAPLRLFPEHRAHAGVSPRAGL